MDLDAEDLEAIRQQAEAVRHPLASLLRYKTAVKVAAGILALIAAGAALFGLSANLGSSSVGRPSIHHGVDSQPVPTLLPSSRCCCNA